MNPFLKTPHVEPLFTRRDFLMRGGGGFGALALAYLLGAGKSAAKGHPLAARTGIIRRGRKASFSFSWKAGPATSICSIPSPG